jgi:hypothetical protein
MEELKVEKSALDVITDVAEVANAVASLLVGHRKILVEGGFDPNLVDSMCANLHSKLLDLEPVWTIDYEESDFLDQHIFDEEEEDE